jgi:hypothetical protein
MMKRRTPQFDLSICMYRRKEFWGRDGNEAMLGRANRTDKQGWSYCDANGMEGYKVHVDYVPDV